MIHRALAIVSIALLAGCDSSPEVDERNASVEEVAKKVREARADQEFVRPGEWESKVTIEKFEMPGMPPEMAQQMKSVMANRQGETFKTCLTKEEVQRPKEDFFAGGNNQCRYDRFQMGDGKINAVMRCGQDGGKQIMQMAGTYSPEKYQMQMSTTIDGGPEAQSEMTMQMRVEAQRVGECSAKSTAS